MKPKAVLLAAAVLAVAAAILGATTYKSSSVPPGEYEYLEKAVAQPTGFEPSFWRCIEAKFVMKENVTCHLLFLGWKDAKAFADGADPSGHVSVCLENVKDMREYPAAFAALMKRVTEGDKFTNAEYKKLVITE